MEGNLIEASADTLPGQVMQSQDWGHATSIPPNVDAGICAARLTDGFIEKNSSDLEIGHELEVVDDRVLLNGTAIALNATSIY